MTTEEQRIKAAWIAFVCQIKPNKVVTLGTGRGPMDPVTFDGRAHDWLNRIERVAHGRSWCRLPSEERLVAVGFFEHIKADIHLHLAINAPTEELRRALTLGEPVWDKLRPRGHYYVDGVESRTGYARYIAKNFYIPATRETPFVRGPKPPAPDY